MRNLRRKEKRDETDDAYGGGFSAGKGEDGVVWSEGGGRRVGGWGGEESCSSKTL